MSGLQMALWGAQLVWFVALCRWHYNLRRLNKALRKSQVRVEP